MECKTKGVALTALETIAETLPKGTQKDALLAVKAWISENATDGYITEETKEKLRKIFDGDEHDRLAREWFGRNCKGEPAHGARAYCLWNAKTKKWEREFPPPRTDERHSKTEK